MAAAFDSWRPAARDAVHESDWQSFCPYSPQSPPLLLASAPDAAAPTMLPLFAAASASTAGSGLAAAHGIGIGAAASSSEPGISKAEAMDVLLNAGGPVWAMDWCPAGTQAGAAAGPTYLALGCHPLESQQNVIGTEVRGPACIQLWELSHPEQQAQQQAQQQQQQQQQQQTPQQQQQQGGLALPRLALALAHDGGVTWCCKWCPDPGLADEPAAVLAGSALPRLGLLAAALGDGSIRVWAVPRPQAVAAQAAQQQQQQQGGPLVLSLPPVAAASSAALGGSMPNVVDWLSAAPHDLLAVGSWDGSVAVLRLVPGQAAPAGAGSGGGGGPADGGAGSMHGLQLLSHFSADVLPLRVLRWAPPAACAAALDSLERQLVVTGGHEGALRVWDLRDPFQPLYSHVLSSNSTILGAEWTERPFGLIVAMEDASLRGLVLDSDLIGRAARDESKAMFSISWRGPNMGAIWALAVQPSMQVAAYAGEDGEVGIFPVEFEGNSKRRMPHSAVAGLRLQGAALAVRTPGQMARDHGLFAGKVMERMAELKRARLPEDLEAVHRVAWSAHTSGAAWLASGGAAGLVRCQWIQSQ
ncbi:hypothetical protein ABPG75_013848 [Micractinium tetrahymenae]